VRAGDGRVHIGLTNVDPNAPAEVAVSLEGWAPGTVSGRILTAATMDAHNSFDQPDTVRPAAFSGARIEGGKLLVTLPPKSLVMLDLQ
jgi:alpha-N-arabinofuranosidase